MHNLPGRSSHPCVLALWPPRGVPWMLQRAVEHESRVSHLLRAVLFSGPHLRFVVRLRLAIECLLSKAVFVRSVRYFVGRATYTRDPAHGYSTEPNCRDLPFRRAETKSARQALSRFRRAPQALSVRIASALVSSLAATLCGSGVRRRDRRDVRGAESQA